MQFSTTLTNNPKPKIPAAQLGFGKVFSDHMFLMDFYQGEWRDGRILPYSPITLDPAASVLHYAQCLFEGQKAFRGGDGKIRIFRPEFHAKRMANGAKRLCMPPLGERDFLAAVRSLVRVDESWVPDSRGASLYIRPTMIATEPFLGVRPSDRYLFFIITSPVGAYYSEGFKPVKIWVEEEYIRAAPGGLGAVKAGANYAASLSAYVQAKARGYSQVLWLDAIEKSLVEEVGTMNVFFRLKNEVVTPPLSGTILNGATRDCVLQVLQKWNVPVRERSIAFSEVLEAYQTGDLLEVFGTGTAAVISAVGELATKDQKLTIQQGGVGELTQKLFDEITGIQYGERPDPFGWIEVL